MLAFVLKKLEEKQLTFLGALGRIDILPISGLCWFLIWKEKQNFLTSYSMQSILIDKNGNCLIKVANFTWKFKI